MTKQEKAAKIRSLNMKIVLHKKNIRDAIFKSDKSTSNPTSKDFWEGKISEHTSALDIVRKEMKELDKE